MTPPIILGIDPGLAACGWCAVRVDTLKPIRAGLVETEKSERKRGVRDSDDNSRRARELYWELLGAGNQIGEVVALAIEAKSFPRSSSAAAKIARALGVVDALACHWRDAPIVQATPQEIKKFVTGRANASKAQVQRAVNAESIPGILHLPASKREHPADAYAAVLTVADSEVIRALRRRVA